MGRFYALWMGVLLRFCQATIYTNDWAIRIRADRESVDRMAEKYGFTNMGQVGGILNTLRAFADACEGLQVKNLKQSLMIAAQSCLVQPIITLSHLQ